MRGMFRSLLILVVVLAVAGCGKSKGSLSGKVTLNGEPLSYGQVSAYNDKNELVAQSTIMEGEYELGDVPVGPVTLTVRTHQPGGAPVGLTMPEPSDRRLVPNDAFKGFLKSQPEAVQKAVAKLKPAPLKYGSAKDSGLTATVAAGSTTYNIELTGKGEIPKALPKQQGVPGGPPVPGRRP